MNDRHDVIKRQRYEYFKNVIYINPLNLPINEDDLFEQLENSIVYRIDLHSNHKCFPKKSYPSVWKPSTI